VDKTLKEFNRILQARHHFITAYTPWANGTVEIVCRQLQSAMRSLLSNFRMQAEDWPSLLPLVHSILSHSKSSYRGGYAPPITVMTGIPASTPRQAVFHANPDSTKTTEATLEELTSHFKNIQNVLEKMQKKVWESISTKLEAKENVWLRCR